MNKATTQLDLYCPDCSRKVLTISQPHDVATMAHRRTCRGCRQKWSLVVRPMGKGNGYRADEVTWGRIAQVAIEETEMDHGTKGTER